jgi:hypothetical protein
VREPGDNGEEEDAARTRELIEAGGDLAGGLIGGGLGLLGGPLGVALGAGGGVLVSRLVKKVGAEIHERILGPRQVERVGVALAAAGGQITKRLESGDALRDDGFFVEEDPEHSPAAELLEGVLLRAADAYQQRKVPYIGFLWASLLFRPDITPDYGHLLLRLADRLTYRQLQALAFFAENANSDELTQLEGRREEEGHWAFADGLGIELNELGGDLGLLGVAQADGTVIRSAGTYNGGDLERVNLWNIALTPLGRNLYELMELDRIPTQEKEGILKLIRAGH